MMKSGEKMENEEVIKETTSAEIPTDTPVQAKIGPIEQRLFGRKIIYADYKENEMNEQTITKILK